MMQQVQPKSAATRADATTRPFVELAYSQDWDNALYQFSARGVPVEAIALLAGHNQTATTELVYRHQIVPALTRGAEVMDQIFG